MQPFIRQATTAFVCLFVGLSPLQAKKSSKSAGFEGIKTSPNLTLTLSTGGTKGRTGKSKKSRKSGRRSSRRKTKLPVT